MKAAPCSALRCASGPRMYSTVPARILVALFVLLTAASACTRESEKLAAAPERPPPLSSCPRFSMGVVQGHLGVSALVEASGLVESRQNPGVLWLNNDSGNPEVLYAVSPTGRPLGSYRLNQASCVDWEDLAIGRETPGGPWYLYVADTGTNGWPRKRTVIYRVPEPRISSEQSPVDGVLDGVTPFTLRYSDHAVHDAETLLFDPIERALFIVTKTTTGKSGVYRLSLPLDAAKDNVARLVGEIDTPSNGERGSERTTGGDISPDGSLIVVKTYTSAYVWPRTPGTRVEQALATRPCPAPAAKEAQGEAVGFAANGSGYFTASEGDRQPLYFFARVAESPGSK